jgi:chorismate dehydratase
VINSDHLDNRWRIGFMPYLNSAVFYSWLEGDWFELVELPPRNMAAAMQRGELDAGPLPISEVLRMKGDVVEGDLGVASDGPARSVLLFSDVPAEEMSGKSVAVTGHTSTSVQLLRVLFRDHWNVDEVGMRGAEEESEAELLIGDPALRRVYEGEKRAFVYDLSLEWRRLTGLPFVFARWVARGDATRSELGRLAEMLHRSFSYGMSHLQEIVVRMSIAGMAPSDMTAYVEGFTYLLGEKEFAAIDEFEKRLSSLPDWRPDVLPYTASR